VKNLGKKKIAIAYQNDDYGKNGVQGAEKELAKARSESWLPRYLWKWPTRT